MPLAERFADIRAGAVAATGIYKKPTPPEFANLAPAFPLHSLIADSECSNRLRSSSSTLASSIPSRDPEAADDSVEQGCREFAMPEPEVMCYRYQETV